MCKQHATELIRRKLQENINHLIKRLPGFYNMPAPVQIALLDFSYNVGPNAKYPKMFDAANRGDWKTMADEMTLRPGLPAGVYNRNNYRKKLILSVLNKT